MPHSIEARAKLDFVLTLRRRWADTLHAAMRAEYDAAGHAASTPKEARSLVHVLASYPWFAWAERNAQKALESRSSEWEATFCGLRSTTTESLCQPSLLKARRP